VVPVPLRRLVDGLEGATVTGETDAVSVTGVTHDSRAVQPGDLYAALPGAVAHGAEFAAAAAGSGAVAALTDPVGVERCAGAGLPVVTVPAPRDVLGTVARDVYADPSAGLLLLGVTGTNGKTTTAYLLESALRAAGHVTGLVGTIETRVGDEMVPSVRTTPEATDLQALFAVMRERGVDAAAMEVSSHALALGRVDGTTYDVAGFTNLSQDHLDFHRDLEDYFAAKARLFTPRLARAAVVNVDDAYGARLARMAGDAGLDVTTVSTADDGQAHWRAIAVTHEPGGGSRFRAVGPGGADVPVTVGLSGSFNVANALLAVAMLAVAGVDVPAAVGGFAGLTVPGRMEPVPNAVDITAVVDYAHTPDAVERAILALREGLTGRLIVVLGCGGDRDRAKRPLMGEVAARLADVLVVTDDNPRSEDPSAIRAAMLEGARRVPDGERADVVEIGERRSAISEAVRRARPGDGVLVAGKGHEQGQEVGGTVHPFDDRTVLAGALAAVVA
jgi:UDP-N-acetylmuramoyl-L-alanyl-D-glutamate--2,6-diaminopimelate ligase